MSEEVSKNGLKTGTTILGIVCKDGVIIASDRQSTAGSITMNKDAEKSILISDYLMLSGTGMVSDIKMMEKVLAAELRLKELRSKVRPTVKEGANLLANLLYRGIRQSGTMAGFLVAGYNTDGTTELYSVEPAGSAKKISDYDANFGSGMPFVLGLLERQYKKGLTVEEGAKLATESLKSSTQRDTGSGYGMDVFAITKDGIKQVIKQKIEPKYEND
jgi:proteasome beta subunit